MAAMTESKDSNVGVNIVKGETLDGERALYTSGAPWWRDADSPDPPTESPLLRSAATSP